MHGEIKGLSVKSFNNFLTKRAEEFMRTLKEFFKEDRIKANKNWTIREHKIIFLLKVLIMKPMRLSASLWTGLKEQQMAGLQTT